jgi:hypothetical protein
MQLVISSVQVIMVEVPLVEGCTGVGDAAQVSCWGL